MDPAAFNASLEQGEPPPDPPLALLALWHAARGDWDTAHGIVQGHEGEADCDWVHAHLHRVEGDAANAGYWYRRARRPFPEQPLAAERDAIAAALG